MKIGLSKIQLSDVECTEYFDNTTKGLIDLIKKSFKSLSQDVNNKFETNRFVDEDYKLILDIAFNYLIFISIIPHFFS